MNSKGHDRYRTAGRALRIMGVVGSLACAAAFAACGGTGDSAGASSDVLHGTIGPSGGELVGQAGSALDGVHLVIPPGALGADTDISVRPVDDETALPVTAVRCGPEFTIEPAGLKLAMPATLTVPFDENAVSDQDRFDDEVKVWVLGDGDKWGQQLQTEQRVGTGHRAARAASRSPRRASTRRRLATSCTSRSSRTPSSRAASRRTPATPPGRRASRPTSSAEI